MSFYGTGINKCVDGKCRMLMNANDQCSKDAECAGGMKCESEHCKGLAEGAECELPFTPAGRPANFGLTNFMCGSGLACALADDGTKHICRQAQKSNGTCDAKHPCSIYQVCNVGYCIKPHSAKVDSQCDVCFAIPPFVSCSLCKTVLS